MAKAGYVEFICRKCGSKAEKKARDTKRLNCFSCEPKCRDQHFFDQRSPIYQERQRELAAKKEAEALKKHVEALERAKKEQEHPKTPIDKPQAKKNKVPVL